MPNNRQPTRRDFIRKTAVASSLFAMPTIIPRRAFGANDRIVTAHIGVGGQGNANLNLFIKAGTSPAAVCDVDDLRSEAAAKSIHQRTGGSVSTTRDYRTILDRQDIDAVVVSTPDHWHALATVDACKAGKDVYCEKPLSLTIAQGAHMVKSAREHKRIVQTGSQQRSDAKFAIACRLVRSGKIGKLREVHVGIPGCNHPFEKRDPVADSQPPSHLDYDRWLGPAAQRPYNVDRVHYNFRFFWDYSGGQMTNFGAHHIDIAHWGMGMDESGPVRVEGTGQFHPQGWIEVSMACRLTYEYPGAVKMIVGQNQKDIQVGVRFIGSEGEISVTRGRLTTTPVELAGALADPGKVPGLIELYESRDHVQNFINCIASRALPICDVAIGHRSATACHLGNLALRTGQPIQWNPADEQFIHSPAAERMACRTERAPYTLVRT